MSSEQIARAALRSLGEMQTPFMLTGSFATNLYGIPRSTKYIDFVVESSDFSPHILAKSLGPDFRLDPQVYFETITGTTRYVIRHREELFAVEVFLLSADDHDRTRFGRWQQMVLHDQTVFVPTAEDVIIAKLRWSARGRRPKDIEDARNVLSVQADNLDWPYIRGWCEKHGTLELLEQIRAEVQSG